MLNVLKKPSEETYPLEKVEIPLEQELPTKFVEAQEVARALAIKDEEVSTESLKAEEGAPPRDEENLTVLLGALKLEERSLVNQKQHLVSNEEQLRLRTIEEIERTRARINGLKVEIPKLKQRCQDLAKALQIPVHNSSD